MPRRLGLERPEGVDLRAYVANRCRDAASFAYPSPSCSELGAHP